MLALVSWLSRPGFSLQPVLQAGRARGQGWGGGEGCSRPSPGWAGWAELVLTLDVDGDRSLLPSRDGFVGGSAHDTLPILHIARGDEEGTHNALTLAISQQGLGERGEKAPCHLSGLAWAGRGRRVPASEKKKEPSAQDSQGCKSLQRAGLPKDKGTRRSPIMWDNQPRGGSRSAGAYSWGGCVPPKAIM